MPTITIKNIPDELYERLKSAAAENRRSINSEVIIAIEEAVTSKRVDLDTMLATARRLRALTADAPITDEQLTELKISGRP